MLSSPSARSSSDLSFFSQSKVSKSGASTTSPVVITTRLAKRPVPTTGSSDIPREVKRHRTASAKEALSKRKSNTSSKNPSRAPSRQHTLPPSPEPIYRSSRSRSTSLFPGSELEADTHKRRWCSDENGIPGETHLSSEMVVKRLMKSYKSCKPLDMVDHNAADYLLYFLKISRMLTTQMIRLLIHIQPNILSLNWNIPTQVHRSGAFTCFCEVVVLGSRIVKPHHISSCVLTTSEQIYSSGSEG